MRGRARARARTHAGDLAWESGESQAAGTRSPPAATGSPVGSEAAKLLADLNTIRAGGLGALRFADSATDVKNLAARLGADGFVSAEDVKALVTAAQDFGGMTDAERAALKAVLDRTDVRFAPGTREALTAFLGLLRPPAEVAGRQTRPEGPAPAPPGPSTQRPIVTQLPRTGPAPAPQPPLAQRPVWPIVTQLPPEPPVVEPLPPAQTPDRPELARGAKGDDARDLQTLLGDWRRGRGLGRIAQDGTFSAGTEAALKAFQGAAGLAETGVVDRDFLLALDRELAAASKPVDLVHLSAVDGAALLKSTGRTGGATVAVGDAGGVRFAKAYGTTGASADPIGTNAIFDLASTSKVVGTTTAALCLVDDGKLALDDKVSKSLPGFGANGKEDITIRQLLSHTSGLVPGVGADWVDKAYSDRSDDKVLKAIYGLKPTTTPGTQVTYSVVQAAVNTVSPIAAQKSVALNLAIERAVRVARADPKRLEQVVWNLVTNGVKFTPSGGRVDVRLERDGPLIRLTVSDTGVGITPDVMPHLFGLFFQADRTESRAQRGLGLGLRIVRSIVDLHGGTVSAESAGEGQGATFTVTLPAADERGGAGRPDRATRRRGRPAPGAGRSVAAGCPDLTGVRVLAVEDDANSREAITAALAGLGAVIMPVASAAEALEALGRLRPHVLLCDIAMPGEDGYSLIRKVRALGPGRGGDTPAAALTALGGDADRAAALAAGFQAHLPKPIDLAVLASTIAGLAGERRPARPRRGATGEK